MNKYSVELAIFFVPRGYPTYPFYDSSPGLAFLDGNGYATPTQRPQPRSSVQGCDSFLVRDLALYCITGLYRHYVVNYCLMSVT